MKELKLEMPREHVLYVRQNTVEDFPKRLARDWLTLHAAHSEDVVLIEKLEKALLGVEHPCMDEIQDIPECAVCGTQTKKHYDYCEVGLALSAVTAWRGEK